MDGFRAYKYYIALKLHFTTDKFDVFANPNVKGSRDAFFARNDKYLFDKMARKFNTDQELIQYLVANFAYGNDAAVYNGFEAQDNFVVWQRRKQSITQILKSDMDKIVLHVEKARLPSSTMFLAEDNFPEVLKLYMGGQVTIEGVSILDDYFNFLDSWMSKLNLIFKEECRRIIKVKRFVTYDKQKVSKLVETFTQELNEI